MQRSNGVQLIQGSPQVIDVQPIACKEYAIQRELVSTYRSSGCLKEGVLVRVDRLRLTR